MSWSLPARVLALAVLTTPLTSYASSPLPPPPLLRAPVVSPAEGLTFSDESLALDCVAVGSTSLRCEVEMRYELGNPADTRADARVDISESGLSGATLTVDGATITRDVISLGSGERARLTVSGVTVVDAHRGRNALIRLALEARHPVLGNAQAFENMAGGLRYRGASEPVRLRVRVPETWTFRRDGGLVLDGAGGEIWLDFGPPPEAFVRRGGPIVGIGGAFGEGVRGRLGYELGLGRHAIGSLNLETDFGELIQIVPTFELATPSIIFLPSLALGIGANVRVAPERKAGLRLQASAVSLAGVVFAADYMPDDGWTLSVMVQVGL